MHRTIPSAVNVPEDSPARKNKRRTSSSTIDASKRPRLSTAEPTVPRYTQDVEPTEDASNPEDAERVKSRRRLGTGRVEEQERKRGQRLFGALLGQIGKFQQDSQSARARAGATRRKEIEEKLQQKLRNQDQELDEKKRKEAEVLKEKLQREQMVFEERLVGTRVVDEIYCGWDVDFRVAQVAT